jgi:hypothetical protein
MSQNAIAARATEATVCNGSGNGPEARRCLICERPAQGRSAYCSDAHRVAAFRLRRRQELAPRAAGLRAELRRRGQLAAHTVYECEDCGERFLGRQRCDGCNRFCRAVGLGGDCPGCDEPLLIADLLGEAWRLGQLSTLSVRPAFPTYIRST